MRSLWKLRADYNLLVQLPPEIGILDKLEVLTVSNNNLRDLPLSLYHLTDKLQTLQLSDNKLKKVSPMIGGLRKLKCLLLHNNILRTLPSELYMLKSLQEFSLEWFAHLYPPVTKVLKDERGFLLIQDFLKLCTLVNGLSDARSSA